MSYWPVIYGALALMSLPLLHWFVLSRSLAVSGRFSKLVDRLRYGAPKPDETEGASQDELLAALRAMTIAELGDAAVEEMPASEPAPAQARPSTPERTHTHALFLAGLVLGGALAAALAGRFTPTTGLHSALFPQIFGDAPLVRMLVLFGGGLLVGAGTRMAGGCTSGHGLCGISQLQPGSFLATASFFGAGAAISFALTIFL